MCADVDVAATTRHFAEPPHTVGAKKWENFVCADGVHSNRTADTALKRASAAPVRNWTENSSVQFSQSHC
jgi:hypothetical protein